MNKDKLDNFVEKHKQKLADLFSFLKENKSLNESIQNNTYKRILAQHVKPEKKPKCMSLLYEISRQQPFGKMNELGELFKYLNGNEITENNFAGLDKFTNTIIDFVTKRQKSEKSKMFCPDSLENKGILEQLFLSLKAVDGFGEKTAALLTKSIFDIQTRDHLKIMIWENTKFENDKIFLPVDAVIKHIFTSHFGLSNPDFDSINYIVTKIPDVTDTKTDSLERISIWDDLWYWGFVTQETNGNVRKTAWNKAKYWTQETLPEINRQKHFALTKCLRKKFISILEGR